MRRSVLVIGLACLLTCGSVFAQSTQTVRVQAAVASVLVFTVDNGNGTTPQIFNFGTVDAAGSNPGNAPRVTAPVVDSVNGTAQYVATGAFNWSVRSAPRSNVTISSASSKSAGVTTIADSVGRTSMGLGQLEMRWLAAIGVATVTNTFTSLTSAPQTWLNGTVGTGNGGPAPRSGGTIDLRLTVDDLDLVEPNEWTIVFTAIST